MGFAQVFCPEFHLPFVCFRILKMVALFVLLCLIHWNDAKALPAISSQSWLKDKGSLDGLSDRQKEIMYCKTNGTCVSTSQSTCLGVKLPYEFTSYDADVTGLLPNEINVSIYEYEFCSK